MQLTAGASRSWRLEWLDQGGDGIASVQHEGLDKVQAEWKLVCMALNLRRMAYL